jgi:FAD synthetase
MRVNPILDWSHQQVWSFLLEHKVPYCGLYDQGYSYLGAQSKAQRNPALVREGSYLHPSMLDDAGEKDSRVKGHS